MIERGSAGIFIVLGILEIAESKLRRRTCRPARRENVNTFAARIAPKVEAILINFSAKVTLIWMNEVWLKCLFYFLIENT